MKKLFTLLVASSVALSTLAAPKVLGNVKLNADKPLKTEIQAKKTMKTSTPKTIKVNPQRNVVKSLSTEKKTNSLLPNAKKMTPKTGKMLAARKADSNNSVEGTWTFDFGDYYFQSSVNGTIQRTFTATIDNGYLWFEDPTDNILPFVAVYDASASTITFPTIGIGDVNLGNGGTAFYKQQAFEYNYTIQDLDDLRELVGKFNAASGTLSFNPDQGLEWQALANQNATEPMGYFAIFDFESATLQGGGSTPGNDGSIEGNWLFTLGDYYMDDSVAGNITYTFTATLEDGYLWFEDPSNNFLPFVAQFNEAAGTLSFNKVLLGSTGQYYVVQQPFEYNWNTDKLDDLTALIGTYSAAAGTITFPEDSGISWDAYADQNATQLLGYFYAYDLVEAKKVGGSTPNNPGNDGEWKSVGNATFMDGWLLTAFGVDQFDESNWYEVPLEQNVQNSNLYRLVGPYQRGPIFDAGLNQSTKTGYIVFDVSDPNHVLFLKADAAFSNSDMGVTAFYCYNQLGFYYEYFGGDYPASTLVELIGDGIPYTTYKNGVVELSYIIDPEYGWTNDANFGFQGAPEGGYTWSDKNNDPVDMSAKIFFPGASGINQVTEVNDAAVRYYNLQGIEITNPEQGKIYIKVEGKKSTKVLNF